MSVVWKEEISQMTLSITFETAEMLNCFSQIFTDEYFELLGLLEKPEGSMSFLKGGGEDEELRPGYVNRFMEKLYLQFAPLFQYDAKNLMSTKPPSKAVILEKSLPEELEPIRETEAIETREIRDSDATDVTEEATDATEATKTEEVREIKDTTDTNENTPVKESKTHLWEKTLAKKWGTLVMSEQEFLEMKKNNIQEDNLEQDKDGWTRPEKDYLERMNKIQFRYKKSLQNANIHDFSILPEITPFLFFICPRNSPYYICLSLQTPRSTIGKQ